MGTLEKRLSLILTNSLFDTVLLRNFEIEALPQVSPNVFKKLLLLLLLLLLFYCYHLSRFAFQFCCFVWFVSSSFRL